MRRIHSSYLEKRTISRIFLLAITAGVMTILVLAYKFLPWVFNLEVGTTLLAALMSIGCLAHIYREHHRWLLAEHDLSEQVIAQLCERFTHLPTKAGLADFLHHTLEQQSSPEVRLNTLKQLQQDQALQLAFVKEVQEIQAEQDVLETLGLNWQQSSNAKEFHISA